MAWLGLGLGLGFGVRVRVPSGGGVFMGRVMGELAVSE